MSNLASVAGGAAALMLSIGPSAQAATTFGPPTPPAFPDSPFQASLFVYPTSTTAVTGVGNGAPLGVTSITIANQSNSAVQVDVFQAVTSGPKCTGTLTSLGASPNIYVMAPALQNTHLEFPTPLVIPKLSGQSCIGFSAVSGLQSGNSLGILVNGFQNN